MKTKNKFSFVRMLVSRLRIFSFEYEKEEIMNEPNKRAISEYLGKPSSRNTEKKHNHSFSNTSSYINRRLKSHINCHELTEQDGTISVNSVKAPESHRKLSNNNTAELSVQQSTEIEELVSINENKDKRGCELIKESLGSHESEQEKENLMNQIFALRIKAANNQRYNYGQLNSLILLYRDKFGEEALSEITSIKDIKKNNIQNKIAKYNRDIAFDHGKLKKKICAQLADVYVSDHYRTLPNGRVTYVRSYTRSK